MTALTKPRMNVDEFLAWAADQPGRHELFSGEVYPISPEAIGHAKLKGALYTALLAAVHKSGRPYYVLPDGATVRVDDATAYEPDALVYCGQELAAAAIEVPEPVIVVEVLSPWSRQIDLAVKLAGYFLLPSLAHYLIVDPNRSLILHHSRAGDAILTRIVTEGAIILDPPGMELALADVYAGLADESDSSPADARRAQGGKVCENFTVRCGRR